MRLLAFLVLALGALAAAAATRAGPPVAAELPLAGFHQAAVEPSSGRVYVTGRTFNDRAVPAPGRLDSTVGVLSAAGGFERGTRKLQSPGGVTVKPGTRDVFVGLTKDRAIVQLNGDTLDEVRRFTLPAAALCPDYLTWASGRVWFTYTCPSWGIASLDPATGRVQVATAGSRDQYPTLAARGQYVVSGGSELAVYRIAGGGLKRVIRHERGITVRDLEITGKGDLLVASAYSIQVLRLPRLTPRMSYGTGGGWTQAVAASPDGRMLLGGADGQDANVYAFRTGRPNAYWRRSFGADPNGKVMAHGLVHSTTPGLVFAFAERSQTVHPFLYALRYSR